MGMFDFLSGQSTNPNAAAAMPAQQYQQFWNVAPTQSMDYSNVLAGGQASPATQGLDFSKIGQWALKQSQYGGQQQAPSFQQALSALNGAAQNPSQFDPAAYQLHQPMGGRPGSPPGQIQQQNAGYIGRGTLLGLLGGIR